MTSDHIHRLAVKAGISGKLSEVHLFASTSSKLAFVVGIIEINIGKGIKEQPPALGKKLELHLKPFISLFISVTCFSNKPIIFDTNQPP